MPVARLGACAGRVSLSGLRAGTGEAIKTLIRNACLSAAKRAARTSGGPMNAWLQVKQEGTASNLDAVAG